MLNHQLVESYPNNLNAQCFTCTYSNTRQVLRLFLPMTKKQETTSQLALLGSGSVMLSANSERTVAADDLTVDTLQSLGDSSDTPLVSADVSQSSLFQDNGTYRRIVSEQIQPSEPLDVEHLEQTGMFEAEQIKTITFENCIAVKAPVLRQVDGKKELVCTFAAQPDIWHQERDELVHARTGSKEQIALVSKAKLQPGDIATVVGIVTQEQELMILGKPTHLTYLNITDIRPGLRATNRKIYGRSASRRG